MVLSSELYVMKEESSVNQKQIQGILSKGDCKLRRPPMGAEAVDYARLFLKQAFPIEGYS